MSRFRSSRKPSRHPLTHRTRLFVQSAAVLPEICASRTSRSNLTGFPFDPSGSRTQLVWMFRATLPLSLGGERRNSKATGQAATILLKHSNEQQSPPAARAAKVMNSRDSTPSSWATKARAKRLAPSTTPVCASKAVGSSPPPSAIQSRPRSFTTSSECANLCVYPRPGATCLRMPGGALKFAFAAAAPEGHVGTDA